MSAVCGSAVAYDASHALELLVTDENPMSERLQQLHDQWTGFVRAPAARVLVWQATADEARMVDAFVTQECDAESALTEDLFVQLAAPFSVSSLHGLSLAGEVAQEYDELCKSEEAGEHGEAWRPPTRGARESDVGFLVRLLSSLRSHAGQTGDGKLAIWLRPSEVGDQAAYLLWLQRLAHEAPSELRFIVLDELEQPTLAPLLAAEPTRVVAQRCDLRVAHAMVELSPVADEADPGALLGALQTRLAALIEAGDLTGAVAAATTGCKLASERGLPHFGAVLQMMLAAAHAAQLDALSALRAYTEADRLAVELEQREQGAESEPAAPGLGQKLQLQARLGQGAVLLAARAFKQAAELYLQAAPLAQALKDERTELDCYRLACVCHAEQGQLPKAWELGLRGFALGMALDDETRRTSSFAFLADHMLRTAERHGEYSAHRAPLSQQAARVLGADWRAQLVSVPAPAASAAAR